MLTVQEQKRAAKLFANYANAVKATTKAHRFALVMNNESEAVKREFLRLQTEHNNSNR